MLRFGAVFDRFGAVFGAETIKNGTETIENGTEPIENGAETMENGIVSYGCLIVCNSHVAAVCSLSEGHLPAVRWVSAP